MDQPQNIFEFFGKLDPPESLYLPLRSVMVENADFFTKQQLLKVYVSSDHLINSDLFYEVEKLVVTQMFPDQGVKIRIIPRFLLDQSLTAVEALEVYHDNILWELYNKNHDIPAYLLYKEAIVREKDQGLQITLDNPFMADLRGEALKEYIHTLLSERFGIEVRITIDPSKLDYGRAIERIVLITNDPERPMRQLRVTGVVR